MKITCTLSEYTKMARQCGENKAKFNCRSCPLKDMFVPDGDLECDIEKFVEEITINNDVVLQPQAATTDEAPAIEVPKPSKYKSLMETELPPSGTEVPEGCLHVLVPRPHDGSGSFETR